MNTSAKFISFEGSEGVGKSTLVSRLDKWLRDQALSVVLTREPGGTELSEILRELVINQPMAVQTELLLLFAARAEHINQVIKPALAAGSWVLCDRFVDASYAYQGHGRGIALDKIDLLVEAFVDVMPKLTFWLDAPVALGLERAAKRSAPDRFEREQIEFFDRVSEGYRSQYERAGERIVRLDATQSADVLFEEAREHLTQLMGAAK